MMMQVQITLKEITLEYAVNFLVTIDQVKRGEPQTSTLKSNMKLKTERNVTYPVFSE